jgi:hypothetical protein
MFTLRKPDAQVALALIEANEAGDIRGRELQVVE